MGRSRSGLIVLFLFLSTSRGPLIHRIMTREEAIENVRSFIGQLTEDCQASIRSLVPELQESKDERIRKGLIELIENWNYPQELFTTKRNIIGYLEKQKEQKSTEWSEEDEKIMQTMIKDGDLKPSEIAWLKSLRPSKDCSDCAKHLEGYISGRSDAENKLLDQFGALITPEDELHIKPRWKPSEAQILAIVEALKYLPNNKDEWMILNTLIDFLKKLM